MSYFTCTYTTIGLLIKYAMNLVSTDRKLEAVELFRVANKPTEAAILIGMYCVFSVYRVCSVCKLVHVVYVVYVVCCAQCVQCV